ncbi:AAA family ATPase [Streptomyces sp. YS415]|uniref:AAA family ATPase n=1 Tax=Streptomyces sp. YS415 TaxID=2944806 RepID=UPI00202276FE|nr:AAA family ATPase [Streptomyces sp. YS415]MCL7430177.1 AAA family ATPase [Streptomyces sp. YS415]
MHADAVLGRAVEAGRDRAFVGRATEIALFRAALAGEPGASPVHYLHGPGGIGKSTLLRRLAREAARAGRPVVEVDARTVSPTPQDFTAAAAGARHEPGAVLLVDTFEYCQGLEDWLSEEFLPSLPAGAVVAVAGRRPPSARWLSDPGWSGLLHVTGLRNLSPGDAAGYLEARGVPRTFHETLLSFTGGNPLGLALAAAVAVKEGEGASVRSGWAPSQDVIATLLPRLVGDIPGPRHRRALEICAHTYVTSESLLRELMGEGASELFAWLRAQPFVESTDTGLFPHDVVREALEADLRWRDPEGFAEMHETVHACLVERVRRAPESRMLQATTALLYLYRAEALVNFRKWREGGHVTDEPYRTPDRERVLELAEAAEGTESAAIVRYWLDRRPEAFRVYRSTQNGETVAFFAWLRMSAPPPPGADPVVDAAWAHARAGAPLRAGEHMALLRFAVYPARYQRTSAPMDLMHWRGLGEIFRDERLAWSFVVKRDDGHWDDYMRHFAMPRSERTARVGSHTYVLFGHDWRAQPVGPWLKSRSEAVFVHRRGNGQPTAPTRGHRELVVLSRAEFDAAVRDALKSLRRPADLAANPLNRSRLVIESGIPLAGLLTAAIDALPADRSADKHRRALRTTYLTGAPTQEAAAERLGLPFSTYRRHLTSGLGRLTDQLWRQELSGAAADPVTASSRRV